MATISTQIDNFTIQTVSGQHSLIGDEPKEFGGQGLGFNPFELLMASLGNCTIVTLTGVAREHQIALEHSVCHVSHKQNRLCYGPNDPNQRALKMTTLIRHIQVWGNISDAERDQLLWGAEHCPVSNSLEGSITLRTTIELMGRKRVIALNESGSTEPPAGWKAPPTRTSADGGSS